ncbi:2Fe-2S iron-sulfur cluster-binding protein [Flammeovirga kamogawensis]|uniref:(2Fe-2S)-binding protein n=1 Tax=Flammeovirga kamogawensis TaxID=373891 RepID=A0ABX8H144_9BACT|nr:2Fe-2S iron-sulfur cluster-binding protein [Flammeovirga kamogawensis]MBB6462647.1 putative molibdopterin-dependent oxidoreductase YjgC [Flammeovirga kamogawensis]QWG09609.1 (2Fe-2S)-binding protein [Flammeovirga kamogawensis]TRX65123.1 2Fe-2S iron-sulfur cluster binding domain-containing protein [Flammeovirga kamogawensis]
MKIIVDGNAVEVAPRDKTLVDVFRRQKLSIVAPCYKTMRKFGTCNSCLVEINGEQKLACGIGPEEGMEVTLKRSDLLKIRKEKVVEFKAHTQKMEALYKKMGM